MSKRVLMIEDEPGLRMTVADRLRAEGYEVETAADGDSGFERASREAFDLVLLDLMLPGRSGLDVCRDLRRAGIPTPILMLTALGQITDKVVGFKLGADDYLTKPFEMAELLARIEALLRRVPLAAKPPDSFTFGQIEVDLRGTQVRSAGKPVVLSAREFQLLRYFIEHQGETLTRERLLKDVWGYEALSTRTVDVHVAWLRQKLQPHSTLIQTVKGLGYRFAE